MEKKGGRFMLVLVLVLLGMTACAGPKISSEQMASIEASRAAAKNACYAAKQTADLRRETVMARMTPEQLATLTIVETMSKGMTSQAQAFTGKRVDECDQGMGAFEYGTEVAKSQNDTIKATAPSVLSTLLGGLTGYFVNDSFKTQAKNGGTHTNNNNSGEGSITSEQNPTNANIDTRTDLGDGGGTVSNAAPTVAGQDKSATSTSIHEAPPEVPMEEIPAAEVPAE